MPAAWARFAILSVGLVFIFAGLIGAVTGAFRLQVACAGTDPYLSVQYQGTVTDAQSGTALASVSYVVSDVTNLNRSLAGGLTSSAGWYSSLVTASSSTQRGCDSIGILFSKNGYVVAWTTVQLPGNSCGGQTCGSTTQVTNYALAQQSPLVASFIYVSSSLVVGFVDRSSGGPNSWSWNFGDGTTSTAQSPSHTYGSAGTYTVQLTVTRAAPAATASTGATIAVVFQGSNAGGSAPPPAPVQTPGPQPATNTTSGGGVQQIRQILAPSIVSVVLILAGAVFVIAAAEAKA